MMIAGRACAKRVRDFARFAMDLVGLADAFKAEYVSCAVSGIAGDLRFFEFQP